MTAPGTASSTAVSLGRNASANMMPPMASPTVRAATPVRLMRDTLDGRYTMTGGVRGDSREQDADAAGVERALHEAEVGRARAARRGALNDDAVAAGP